MSGDELRSAQTCLGCVHFFVTHEPAFPYGCRALGFKSKRYPCHEVHAASGLPCEARQIKKAPSGLAKSGGDR